VHGIDAQRQAVLRPVQLDLLALPENFPGGLGEDPRQQLDERGLAGAIFADDGVNRRPSGRACR
jgi:hypothetical protein